MVNRHKKNVAVSVVTKHTRVCNYQLCFVLGEKARNIFIYSNVSAIFSLVKSIKDPNLIFNCKITEMPEAWVPKVGVGVIGDVLFEVQKMISRLNKKKNITVCQK